MNSTEKNTTARKAASARRRGNSSKRAGNRQRESGDSALALLKEDHREVQKIFRDFRRLSRNGGNDGEKRRMVMQACEMLTVHAQIEEEIFYPAMRRHADEDAMDEAIVEHDGAKDLIAQLQDMEPGDHLFDAKFTVLGEMVKHHIEEEESRIFPKAKKAGIDLAGLGREMKYLKERIEDDLSGGFEPYFTDGAFRRPPRGEGDRYMR
jgi:hemerythrin superfamily protein